MPATRVSVIRCTTVAAPASTNAPSVAAVTAWPTPVIARRRCRGNASASAPAGTPTKNSGSIRMPRVAPTMNGEFVSSRVSQPSTTVSPIIPTELKSTEAARRRKSPRPNSVILGAMADTAEVLIVGAGIMGVSTAYHLARLGVKRVVVLERDTVCSGSTALASGGIRHQYANRLGVELTTHSIVTYERFREEFGVDPQFRQHGYLILIATEAELATARRSVALQRSLGVDVELLDAAGTRALCPYLNTADLLGATYTPRDGYADPYLCATAIAARARDLGVVIRQQHEVRAFTRQGDRITGATTAGGTVHAGAVVIATGAWTGVVGALAGVAIPVRPLRRHKFMTAPFPVERIPAATPFVIDPHRSFSLRREGAGLLLGHGRRDEPGSFDTEVDRSLEPRVVERAIHRAPALADAALMRGWAGLYEMTPDQTGIVSAVPAVTGLHVIAGFSGHGFMHGPIAGQLMAEILVHGRAVTMDASALDLARFARGEAHVEPLTFV
jgi:sarcosine oxidase subunit beta